MQASVQSCDSSKGKTAFTRLTGNEQQITLKWKNPENITGYQIQYGLKKNFKGAEKTFHKNFNQFNYIIKMFKANMRIRL